MDRLEKTLTSPKMQPTGAIDPLIYVLGEAPGEAEDGQAEQFIGSSGQLLRRLLPTDIRVRYNNTIRCRPPKNRTPTPTETNCCYPSIVHDIEKTKPQAILAVGATALHWLTGMTGISAWRGTRIPVRVGRHECWCYPIFHPAYLLRMGRGSSYTSELEKVTDRDIQRIATPPGDIWIPTEKEIYDDIQTYSNEEDIPRIRKWLRKAKDCTTTSIDIETTGLRPYVKGARILSIAISNIIETIAFPWQHSEADFSRELKDVLLEYLHNENTKVAHNVGFELEWLMFFFGRDFVHAGSWEDTQVAQYVLDERWGGRQKLDSICLERFGFNLKDQSDVDVKTLDEQPIKKVLRYNALDAKWTHHIYEALMEEIADDASLMAPYVEHTKRVSTIVEAQMIGVYADTAKACELHNSASAAIKEAGEAIATDSDVARFEKERGKFKPTSPKECAILFRDVLGFQQEGEKYSVDVDALKRIDRPIAQSILKLREYTKLQSTYIEPFTPGGKYIYSDGKIHCQYNGTLTATGRLSSDHPNMQNFPKRKHKEIRGIVRAPNGCVLLAVDYGQLEARVIGMASADERLCKYIIERNDIHMDWSERLVEMVPAKLDDHDGDWKKLRSVVKNKAVFPLFYGAAASSIARYLEISPTIAEQFYETFWIEHSGVKNWQETVVAGYDECGYVECLTGRRRRAPLTREKVINTPIQGSGSDIVVSAWRRLATQARKENKPWLHAPINVHDDLTFVIPVEKISSAMEDIVPTMLAKCYDWMTIPISVEVSIGNSWDAMEEIGTFYSDESSAY